MKRDCLVLFLSALSVFSVNNSNAQSILIPDEKNIKDFTEKPKLEKYKDEDFKPNKIQLKNNLSFKLEKVEVIGNRVVSNEDLAKTYNKFIAKDISAAEIVEIVNCINQLYNNRGYIRSFAIPAKIDPKSKTLTIKIIEAGFRNIIVDEDLKSNKLLLKYIENIRSSNPLTREDFQRNISLIKEFPGVQILFKELPVDEISDESKISDLYILSLKSKFNAEFSIDNKASDFIGPQNIKTKMHFNDLLNHGEQITLNLKTTDKLKKSNAFNVAVSYPLNDKGLNLRLAAGHSNQEPAIDRRVIVTSLGEKDKFLFKEINGKTISKSTDFSSMISSAPILTFKKKLKIFAGYNIQRKHSEVKDFNLLDKMTIGKINFGFNYFFVDSLSSINYLNVILHVSNKSFGTKFDASKKLYKDNFKYLTADFFRRDDFKNNLTLFTSLNAQYTNDKLVSSEKISYSNNSYLRGFSSAVYGDKGLAVNFELSKNKLIDNKNIKDIRYYSFLDGALANLNNEKKSKKSGLSTGVGFEINLKDNISASYEIAKPIYQSKNISAKKNIKHYFMVKYKITF